MLAAFEQRYGRKLPLDEKGFNAGVFVFNLARWRALNMTAEAEFWIDANNREKLYSLGSQPPLLLSVFGMEGRCQELPGAAAPQRAPPRPSAQALTPA